MPTPPNTEPPADIGHELRELNRKFSRIEGVLLRTLLRKESRAQQAKVAGVHRSTLCTAKSGSASARWLMAASEFPNPPPPMKYNEVEEMCRVTLTSDDLVKIGENAGDNGLKKTQLGSELERIKKDYKNRIEALAAEIELDHEKLRTKYEMRKTLCFWTYDTPKKGRKTLRRVDTGEVIRDEVMDGNDTQHVMATIDAEAATQAVAKAVTGDAGALPQLPADIAPPTGSAPA